MHCDMLNSFARLFESQSPGDVHHSYNSAGGFPLALDRVNDALIISQTSRLGLSNVPRLHRHNFLSISQQSGAIYESVRGLIQDERYWEIEEQHFRTINGLILDYNISNGTQGLTHEICDSTCPAVETIRRLFQRCQRYQDGLDLGMTLSMDIILHQTYHWLLDSDLHAHRSRARENHLTTLQKSQRKPRKPLQQSISHISEPISSRTRSYKALQLSKSANNTYPARVRKQRPRT